MCGIVGNILARADRRPDPAVLQRMNERLAHRGPDDEGILVQGPAGLAMRRLKIIDLATGHQPMAGEGRRVWVVFNGEIYNYRELGANLAARGHTFTTHSDTEVIVHGYEDRGLASLDDLEGMFAFAIWDAPARTLVLARDRLGIKPLYYAVLPDQIVFASELRALVEHPAVERTLDLTALSRYLAHEYVPAPHSIFRGVRKLAAGHWLTYSDGRVKVEPYWDVRFQGDRAMGEADAVEALRAVLDLSVRQHLVSDVPLGVFLSGGIDSSAVAALAARHLPGRLKTFSIGFEDPSFDETAHARSVARGLDADHHEEILGPRAALDLVARLPELLDEPLGDASLLPTFLLSRFTRRSVTVALSGDGGDELFAGYPTYQAHRLARALELVPRWVRQRLVRPVVERLPVSLDDLSFDFRLKRFLEGMDFAPVERHAAWLGAFTPAEQRALFTSDALARMEMEPSYAAFHEMLTHAPSASGLERMLYLDLKGYLGEGVLTKVDRASMACSLEVRLPLLDRRVVELAASLPMRLKLRGLTTKYVLKRALSGVLPRAILERRKKGFGVPLARWFRAELAPLLQEACAPDMIRRAGLFRPEAVERLIGEHAAGRRDHRKKLYTLLAFQLWASRYHPA
ncbi:MAG: asparagine synthase (glutamine-hydrolyzing) [Candidatus Rokuibacteriota bacterium]|nr:MAG: asparagine synthase (glutamine-hydrolyzing) [Candidatus Rokubacteria bacterium]